MGYGSGCAIQLIGGMLFLGLMDISPTFAFLLLFVFGIGGWILGYKITQSKNNDLRNSILMKMNIANPQSSSFQESKYLISNDYESKIAIDEKNKKVCIWTNTFVNAQKLSPTFSKYEFTSKLFNFSEILSVEIIKDGKSITNVSRSSQIGGALVGGILAGGVGAVIGGLSGSSTTMESTSTINLGITVNDFSNPYYIINFYSERDAEVQTTNDETAMFECKKWFGILSFLIKEIDKIEKVKDDKVEVKQFSLSTELSELNKLKEQGILTDDEFQNQKTKLLNAI